MRPAIGSASPIWSRPAPEQAQVLGVDGLVCSPEEAATLRKIVGHQMHLVTPGIRPAGAAVGDQKRIMTPARAIAAGADYLVVGRPVMEAADPKAAADAIQAEIAQALAHERQQGRSEMAKGYWIGRVDVHNDGRLQALCGGERRDLQEIRRPIRGARRQVTTVEGQSRSRNVVIEFPDYETALACYSSPEYQENIKVRQPHSDRRSRHHRRL